MEAGYKCGNPTCRNVITLELHHIEYVSDGGGDDPSNLLVLCPYCHSEYCELISSGRSGDITDSA